MNGTFDEFERLWTEREIDTASCSKQICDDRKRGTVSVPKEQGLSFLLYDSAMYLRDLEVRIYLRRYLNDLILAA